MRPSRQVFDAVEALNRRLGGYFGFTVAGIPKLRWAWSEDLWWEGANSGEFEEVPTGGLLALVTRKRVKVKMCPWLEDQWVAVKWLPMPEYINRGWKLDAVQRGESKPLDGRFISTNAHLPPGQTPDESATEELKHEILRQLGYTEARLNEETLAAEAADEREKDRLRGDIIEDALTAYLNDPGKRGGSVSFPSVNQTMESDSG